MQKRTREILAIVLLVVLGFVAAAAMGYYILIGHNWNVTASNIDDSIGQMEGYTVFLYEGTRPRPAAAEQLSDSRSSLDEGSSGESASLEGADQLESPVTLADVAENYREKGAIVFSIDMGDLDRYSDPIIVQKAGKRVGILTAMKPLSNVRARLEARKLVGYEADYIVAITDDDEFCAEHPKHIDLVICRDANSSIPLDGAYYGSSFCVGAPYAGEVQAVIISPSGVHSSKTVDSL